MRYAALILLTASLAALCAPTATAQTGGSDAPTAATRTAVDAPSFRELLTDDGAPLADPDEDWGLPYAHPAAIDVDGVGSIERSGDSVYISGDWLPVDVQLQVVTVLEQELVTFRGALGDYSATFVVDERGDAFAHVDGSPHFIELDAALIPLPDGDGDTANATVGTTGCWLIPAPGIPSFGGFPGYFGPMRVQVVGDQEGLGAAIEQFKAKRDALVEAGWIPFPCLE